MEENDRSIRWIVTEERRFISLHLTDPSSVTILLVPDSDDEEEKMA